MVKFGKPPSPSSTPRAFGIKIPREVESADENHCRNYGTFKISIKNDCENERERKPREGKSKWKWKMLPSCEMRRFI